MGILINGVWYDSLGALIEKTYKIKHHTFQDRNDAARTLMTLRYNAGKYGSVSVADYYCLIDRTPMYQDSVRGWNRDAVAVATIVPAHDGYIIKFPQVEVI